MVNTIVPIYEYGYYGYNVFELPTGEVDTKRLPTVSRNSEIRVTFNMSSQSTLVDININTGDYYKAQTNEDDYTKLIDFIKVNQIGKIPRISSKAYIMLHYALTTMDGAPVDAGIKVTETDMLNCVEVLPISGIDAPYRLAKHFATEFTITRFNIATGPVARTPFQNPLRQIDSEHSKFILHIDCVRVLGTPAGNERFLPNCMNGGHYAMGSQTILDIEKHSVELFSTTWYDIKFNTQEIPAYVKSISIPIEVITPMIVTTDVSEIDRLLAANMDEYYPGDIPGNIIVDMFEPLIQRPHCPGGLPHDYFKYWDCVPGKCPNHHGNGSYVTPVGPGPEWPNHGNIPKIDVNKIDENTSPGVYTHSGILKYSWRDLINSGIIEKTYTGDNVTIGIAQKSGAKISTSDIGPILVIPSPDVTASLCIASKAFFGCERLEKVYLPKECRNIGNFAFYGCSKLQSVYLPEDELNGLTQIGHSAFMNCTSIRWISTSLSLNTIGDRAFYHCAMLYLTVPPSVGKIGEDAFHEVFKIECSPKLSLDGTGINPKDVIHFEEGHKYYNPEDYREDSGNGGDENKGEPPAEGGGTQETPDTQDPDMGDTAGDTTKNDNTSDIPKDSTGTDDGDQSVDDTDNTSVGGDTP